MNEQRAGQITDACVLAIGVAFALFVRFSFRNFGTQDFFYYTSRWYAAVQDLGLKATATDVSNYTPPYLYLLYLVSVTLPALPTVVAIKIPSVIFDFVCAALVYRMVGLKYADRRLPMLAFLVVMMAPTIVANGSVWGQADSIYTAMLLACVYLLMTGRTAAPMIAFGAALAFKFQAMFLAPFLCALWLRGRLPFWAVLLAPATYAVTMIPAWLEGRTALELATIYASQAGAFHTLTRNAPNLYAWLPQRLYSELVVMGLILMTGIGCAFVWLVWRSRAKLGPALLLRLSLLSLLMVPYFLPKMHDRYFFPADVLSIAYGFYFPSQFYVPVAISFASLCVYLQYLLGHPVVSLRLLALVMAAAMLPVAVSTYRDLRAGPGQPSA